MIQKETTYHHTSIPTNYSQSPYEWDFLNKYMCVTYKVVLEKDIASYLDNIPRPNIFSSQLHTSMHTND